MKRGEVNKRIPDGFTVLQNDDSYFYPARVTHNQNIEYLRDEKTNELAKFWSLSTALIFVQEYAARHQYQW
jgi:hypothetical protein